MNEKDEGNKVSALVTAWFEGETTMFDAVTDEPEIAWRAILEISNRNLTDEEKALLAAGALESLLVGHGAAFIDRIEAQARTNSRFSHLLGGVWRQDMPDQIWERIERVRGSRW